jgi:hypothetical protein
MPIGRQRLRLRTSETPGPRAEHFLQVFARQTLLLHPELDRLDRVGRVHGIVLGLVGIDQRRQHVDPVTLGRA